MASTTRAPVDTYRIYRSSFVGERFSRYHRLLRRRSIPIAYLADHSHVRRSTIIRWVIASIVLILALFASTAAHATLNIASIAHDEIHRNRFVLPPHTIVTIDYFDANGWTVITPVAVRYTIVLKRLYASEAHLRYVVSHEIGHVMLDQAHIAQSEVLADRFAACFGSEKARWWARTVVGVEVDDATCASFKAKLTR